MSDDDIIRKAVELANRWAFYKSPAESRGEISPPYGGCWWEDEIPDMFLDALAAQLKSQFSDGSYAERLTDGGWQFQFIPYNTCERSDWFEAETESMAAIRAIVESGVLNDR